MKQEFTNTLKAPQSGWLSNSWDLHNDGLTRWPIKRKCKIRIFRKNF